MTRTEEILAELNAYTDTMRGDNDENIWQDVIYHLPEFDGEATEDINATRSDSTTFAVLDGTVIHHDLQCEMWKASGTIDDWIPERIPEDCDY